MATSENTAVVTFGTPTATWTQPTHYSIWADEATDILLLTGTLSGNPDQPTIGRETRYNAGAFDLTFPRGDFEAAGMLHIVDYYLDNKAIMFRLHSASPGSNGANELTGNGYARATIAAGGWTTAQ